MKLPVKTNMVSLKMGIQHFIPPQTICPYLEKFILNLRFAITF